MLKEKILQNIKENLKTLINTTKDKYLSKLDEDIKIDVETIINKDNYTLEDVNTLLIDYFPYELNEQELFQLIKSNSSIKKKINKNEVIIYIIKSYLINIEEYQLKLIEIIDNSLNLDDINILEQYLTDKNNKNNQIIYHTIKKLSNTKNPILKNIIDNLNKIFNIFEKYLLDLNMIKKISNEEIIEYNNYYFQYQEVINKLVNQNSNITKENILLCLVFTNNIDDFKNYKLTKEDLISFLNKLETNGFILNDNQLNNLLNNFRNKYYLDNDKNDYVNNLKKKVFETYDNYFNSNFYFKVEDFVDYYNKTYQDDFSVFLFEKEYKPLTRNIFDSFFSLKNVNETTVALETELTKFKSFAPSIIDYKINCLENDKIYYERYKFYLKYIDTIQEYLQHKDDMTIEYYILKNISQNDRSSFYELFKSYYGPKSKEIGRNAKSIKKSYLALKQEYIEELNNTDFNNRYEVLNKFKGYCVSLRSISLFNEEHLQDIMKDYENKYYNVEIHSKKRNKKKHNI